MAEIGKIPNVPLEHVINIPSEAPSSPTNQPTICRTPSVLRDNNVHDFCPRLVSIGPYHYGKKQYAKMETYKFKMMNIMLTESGKNFNYMLHEVGVHEEKIRAAYDGVIELESQAFIQMMLMDSAFILFSLRHEYDTEDKERGLYIKMNQVPIIQQDLLLFENQLPAFLLSMVYIKFFDKEHSGLLAHLFLRFIPPNYKSEVSDLMLMRNLECLHAVNFVDVFRLCVMSGERMERDIPETNTCWAVRPLHNATRLRRAGVKLTR